MFERFRSRLSAAIAPKQTQAPSSPDVDSLYRMILQRNPPKRTTTELIAAFKSVPEFRAVVSKIADHVASVNWRLYIVKGGNGKARKTRAGYIPDMDARRKELAGYKRTGELVEVEDNPMARIFDVANPEMPGFAARRLNQIYMDVVGEAFSVLSRNVLGAPTTYWPMAPNWVTPPSQQQPDFEIRINGRPLWVPKEDMLWSRELNPSSPYGRGTGIGEALGDELDISDFAAKYVKAFFYNRGKPDLIVGVENGDKELAKRAQTEMMQQHQGYARAHRVWFTNGKLSFKELNAQFRDMQTVELKGAVRDSFVNTFGIPPEVLGIITNSNRATIREALRMFVIETIVPRLERARHEYQHVMTPMYDDRLLVDYDDPVPVDTEDQLKAMQAAPWAPTRGEWREAQGLEHRGDIDEVHVIGVSNLIRKPEENDDFDEMEPVNPDDAKSEKHVTKDDVAAVDNVLEALRPERLSEELDPVWRAEITKWGDTVLEDLGTAISFDILNPLVADHLEEFSTTKIKGLVHRTTRKRLREQLIEGVRAGEDTKSIAARVRAVFSQAKGARALAIARTEVARSANFATWSAYDQSGVVEKKQWLSTPDDRLRDAHSVLNGQIRELHERFEVDGSTAMYPGDFGVPELDINCRCTTTVVMDEPKSAAQFLAEWKTFDRRLLPWETLARAALTRGFNGQQGAVLAAVAREFGSNGNASIEIMDNDEIVLQGVQLI